MDNRSPRSREILGPRPTPLKIRKDSHKITKKPPLPPPQIHQQEPSQSQPEVPRGPVIIYTVSPKIIHTHPNNFMTLVQRLTGKNSSSASSSTAAENDTSAAFSASSGLISPAARFAATEKANMGCIETMDQYYHHHHQQQQQQNRVSERPSCYHGGILFPGPNSLPLISPEFFSTVGPIDQQRLSSFYNEFSSVLQTSPSTIQSPYSMDLFNNFFDS